MKMITLFAISVGFFSSVTIANESTCVEKPSSHLALDYQSFDQDMDGGWRAIDAIPDCEGEAADLISLYINENQKQLSEGQIGTLHWHEGQLRAANGETSAAVKLFQKAYHDNENMTSSWNLYVRATIAFLQKDRAALLNARRKLAAIPKPDGFDPRDADGNPVDIPWPPNLNVVDRLVACFGVDYSEAYGECETN